MLRACRMLAWERSSATCCFTVQNKTCSSGVLRMSSQVRQVLNDSRSDVVNNSAGARDTVTVVGWFFLLCFVARSSCGRAGLNAGRAGCPIERTPTCRRGIAPANQSVASQQSTKKAAMSASNNKLFMMRLTLCLPAVPRRRIEVHISLLGHVSRCTADSDLPARDAKGHLQLLSVRSSWEPAAA